MLSFVIPAYNEEAYLPRTIRAMHASAAALGEPYEIVVADDSSSDRTAEVARQLGAIVTTVSNRQIAATRNAGAKASRGHFLIFVDADTQVNPRAVAAALNAMRRGARGGGATMTFDGEIPTSVRLMMPFFMTLWRLTSCAAGAFLFCTRDAFTKTGGFDEGLFASEEVTMSQALKRCGRFVVLREKVVTSGRKLRAYSVTELMGLLMRGALSGQRAVRTRDGLDLWYDRREMAGEPGREG